MANGVMSSTNPVILQVALAVPLRRRFDYLVNDEHKTVQIGQRVLVPFGNKKLVGIVDNISDTSDFELAKLKPVLAILDDDILFNASQHALLNWASRYFQHPIGDVYNAALPSLLKTEKSLTELLEPQLTKSSLLPDVSSLPKNATQQIKLCNHLNSTPINKSDLTSLGFTSATVKKFVENEWAIWQTAKPQVQHVTEDDINPSLQLNNEQAIAVSVINQNKGADTFLLEGVTGSGKTEVYLQVIEPILLQQQQVLVLVPEIGLTPQTVARFEKRFNVPVCLWHSAMTDKQKFTTWHRARSGEAKIVIATRSGIFLPFADIGLIIIDEEHDPSFKQQDGFKYHCRSLALYRAKLADIPVVMGSATPSLETIHNVNTEKFKHLTLQHRATSNPPPAISLIDLNQTRVESGISELLLTKVAEQLANNQQVILFINRRGFAPVLMCEECHWLSECHRCSSFTTYHKSLNQLICHHCGEYQHTISQCGGCGSTRMTTVGVGTEQIEDYLTQQFPDYPVVRLDRDSTSKKGEFNNRLKQIQQGSPQIIVGTQMIAKGHHFPNVSLVGVVDVDGSLFSSDFRASEKLAQLIVQVAGRAGRGQQKGDVYLQTKFPEHPVIQDLVNNQYQDFAKFALSERQMMSLPPYSHQIAIRAESMDVTLAGHWLAQIPPLLSNYEQLLVIGPTPANMSKKAGKYRFNLIIQCQSRTYLHKVTSWLIESLDTTQKDNRIRWFIDVDPLDVS